MSDTTAGGGSVGVAMAGRALVIRRIESTPAREPAGVRFSLLWKARSVNLRSVAGPWPAKSI